jgi:hexosaminidase
MIAALAVLWAITSVPTITLGKNDTSQYDLNVLPLPHKYTIGSEVICLSTDFQIYLDSNAPQDLHDAVGRTMEQLRQIKHEYLSVYHGTEFFDDGGCSNWLSSLTLSFDGDEHSSASISEGAIQQPEDRIQWESYHLTVPTNGSASLSSPTALGLFRGLTTFSALFYYIPEDSDYTGQQLTRRWNWQGGYLYAPFGPYEIWDKPAFGWRSLLLDTSRNFFSIGKIQKVQSHVVL